MSVTLVPTREVAGGYPRSIDTPWEQTVDEKEMRRIVPAGQRSWIAMVVGGQLIRRGNGSQPGIEYAEPDMDDGVP